jgi:hypothetical protein
MRSFKQFVLLEALCYYNKYYYSCCCCFRIDIVDRQVTGTIANTSGTQMTLGQSAVIRLMDCVGLLVRRCQEAAVVAMELNESPAMRPRRRRLSYSSDYSEQEEDEGIQEGVSNSEASTILYDSDSPDTEEASILHYDTESPDMEVQMEVVDLTRESDEIDLTRDSSTEDEQSDYLA